MSVKFLKQFTEPSSADYKRTIIIWITMIQLFRPGGAVRSGKDLSDVFRYMVSTGEIRKTGSVVNFP